MHVQKIKLESITFILLHLMISTVKSDILGPHITFNLIANRIFSMRFIRILSRQQIASSASVSCEPTWKMCSVSNPT